jgi:hypothetical protein
MMRGGWSAVMATSSRSAVAGGTENQEPGFGVVLLRDDPEGVLPGVANVGVRDAVFAGAGPNLHPSRIH